jgi:hypothetical protein
MLIGFLLLVSSFSIHTDYELTMMHFDFALLGFYLSWFVNYTYNKRQKKFTEDVMQDFAETLPLMNDMLGTIKKQQDTINDLKEKLDNV